MTLKALLFRLLAISLPFLLLLLLEGVLRLAGVASASRRVFQPVPGHPDYQAVNPAYVQRYFRAFQPAVAFNPFLKKKDEHTFRVFVLGGSSAAGFPYQFYHGFPARLAARLEAGAPGQRIEVVNLGMTAVNSYTLWDLKDAVVAQQPDAVLIYAGHNEYYGAFGAGSSIYALGNRPWLKRSTLRLKRSVLYGLLERLLTEAPPDEPASAADRTMMAQVVRDAAIGFGGDVFQAGVSQYEANMRAVLAAFRKAGIPVYLGTLTANLRDQPPLGEDAGARQAYREGLALLNQGDTLAAHRTFLEAKELDDVRFRAPEAINRLIRRFADDPQVTLVDLQSVFRQQSPQGLEGDTLFTDHLHPNARGYDLMAEAFFQALWPHPRLKMTPDTRRVPATPVVDALDHAHASLQIARLKGGYPFKKTVKPEEAAWAFQNLLQRHLRSGRYADSLAVLALTGSKTPPEALLEATRLARSRSDTLAALLFYRSLLHWQPFNRSLIQEAVGYALNRPTYDALVGELAQFAAHRTGHLDHLNALAAVRLRQGLLNTADVLLAAVERRDPTSKVMLFNKARLLVLQGDTLGARRYFERYRAVP